MVDASLILFLSLLSDSGIGLESGVFVASLAPGSPAVRDCTLAVGDRLLAVSILPKIFLMMGKEQIADTDLYCPAYSHL